MRVELLATRALRFDDGTPVRAASAVVPYGDGRLVVQDDATHAAWVREGSVTRVRVLPPVEGLDLFDEAAGTKRLKPDLEAACALAPDRLLLLGSGSSPARTRAVVVTPHDVVVADLAELYGRVGALLATPPGALNLEGACLVGGRLRWFRRGAASVPSASVDVDLPPLLALLRGAAHVDDVGLHAPRRYDLGDADGVPLAVTDAVALPDGRVLVSLAAEDTADPVEDGPVVAAALAVLDGDRVVARVALPEPGGRVHKVEGLAVLAGGGQPLDGQPLNGQPLNGQPLDGQPLDVVAVVDDDDPLAPSAELVLRVSP